ncbi:MAG: thioredoxin [Cyanobacteria bacterium SZAS-4]|nr:thioredoxin [Cyanobacteria bacterium SZAS-4]
MKNWFITVACGALLLSGCSSSSENKIGSAAVEVQSTSDKTFEKDVLAAKEPVLVDFYATWCGPCKHMAPVVDEVANEFAGKAKVFKVDVDQNPMLSQGLGIESIPTLVVFKGGKPIAANTGAIPKSELVSMLESAFAPSIAGQKDKTAL